MHKSTKFSWKYYFEPTPRRMRVLGDAILAASGAISTGSLISSDAALSNPTPEMIQAVIQPAITLSLWATILGFVGKFITTFFKEEEDSLKERSITFKEEDDKPEDNASK